MTVILAEPKEHTMDSNITATLLELGNSLTMLIAKSTATMAATKIKALKCEKDTAAVRSAYDDLVNQLLEERSEAIRIAQAYKAELERVQISDEDIQSLDATIGRILEILSSSKSNTDEASSADVRTAALGQFRQLISADTLRTMQLLGFNYKAAIGEPLTELCANKIRQFGEIGKSKARPTGKR